jgi:acetyl esterase/lipase
MVDDEAGHRPGAVGRHSRMWNETTNRIGWESYLRGADREVAVPIRRRDLGGLPPAWLGVGTVDPLHGEGTAYARRLQEAGVPCELDVVPGAFHGFDAVAPGAAVSRDFFERQCRALERAFETAGGG